MLGEMLWVSKFVSHRDKITNSKCFFLSEVQLISVPQPLMNRSNNTQLVHQFKLTVARIHEHNLTNNIYIYISYISCFLVALWYILLLKNVCFYVTLRCASLGWYFSKHYSATVCIAYTPKTIIFNIHIYIYINCELEEGLLCLVLANGFYLLFREEVCLP